MQAPKMSTDNAGTSLLVSGASGPQGVAVDATRVYWVTYYGGLVQAASLDGGGLVTLASAQSYPEAIAVTGGAAYWTTSNALGGAPLDGGPSFVAATDQENPTSGGLNTDVGIAVDATYVYWADYSGGALNATALGGGPLLEVGAGQNPLGVAVDTTSIYWTDYGAGTVKKTSKCLLATGTVAYLPD
jgi:hypothetical protein